MVKPLNNTFKTQKIKLNLLIDLSNTICKITYFQNWKKTVFLILQTKHKIKSIYLKTLFTDNHEKADEKIAYHCSSLANHAKWKPMILIYWFWWFMIDTCKQTKTETEKERIMKNLAVSFACFWYSFIHSQVVITLVNLIF